MKQLFGAMLVAMLSAGCSYETGAEGTPEVADEENLGSISEALTTGDWLPTFLAPLAPKQLPGGGGWQVCRANAMPGSHMPGYTDGGTCHYPYNGFAYHTTVFQRVEQTGLSWVNLGVACGSSTCVVPGVKPKIVGTAGWGICAVQIGGQWRAGHLNENNACYTSPLTGNVYTRTAFNTGMKVLIKN